MPNVSSKRLREQEHWFAGKDSDVLLFKVNRRPLLAGTLFETSDRMPRNALQHALENLGQFSPSAESGRAYKRLWQVGNVEATPDYAVVTGRLGWARTGRALSTYFDKSTRQWRDREVPGDRSAVAPFALIADGRYLGVLRHHTFSDSVIAQVLTNLLNDAERQRPDPTTDWDVEPVGDMSEFLDWLEVTDQVTTVEFVFKRPNPDAEESFRELYERQAALRAEEIRETIKTRNSDIGLNKAALRDDPIGRQFLAAAMAAYGYVRASGSRNGRGTTYDQRSRVARERVSNVGDSWDAATQAVVDATRRGRWKRRGDG